MFWTDINRNTVENGVKPNLIQTFLFETFIASIEMCYPFPHTENLQQICTCKEKYMSKYGKWLIMNKMVEKH